MTHRPILAMAVAAALNPLGAQAVGVGSIELYSALNEVLDAQIALHKVDEGEVESLTVSLASPEAFAKAGLERPYYLTDLRFSTELGASGQPLIKVKSQNPIREPFLNFLVEVNWPKGKVMREFTLLLDPPTTFRRPPSPVAAVQLGSQPIPLEVKPPAVALKPAPPVEEYRVETNDTLWSIAKRYRPDGTSIQEMLMAIYRNNPHAFSRNDMNMLLAGRTLKIPGPEALAIGTEQDARRAYQAQLMGEAAAQEGQLSPTGIQPEPIDARGDLVPPVDRGDRVEILTPADQVAGQAGDFEQGAMIRLERDLMLARELNERVNAENNELQERLQRLESQLADLETLLRMKSDGAAQIQEQLGQADEPSEVIDQIAPEQVVSEEPLEAEAATKVEETVAAETPEPTGEVIEPEPADAAEQVTDGASSAESSTAEVDQPKPKPVTAAQPTPVEPSLLDTLLGNPLVLAGAGGLLLLVLLLLLLKSRRKQPSEESPVTVQSLDGVEDADIPSFEDDLGSHSDLKDIDADEDAPQSSLLLDFTPSELEGLGADTEIDPVSEADVYVAYGRYHQAVELLREGMERNPERSDIKVKLLEVLHAAGERDEFLKYAAQFANEGLPKQNSSGWSRIVNLGKQIDADHPLFASAASLGVAAAASTVLANGPSMGVEQAEKELADLEHSSLEVEGEATSESLEPTDMADSESGLDDDLLDLDALEVADLELETQLSSEVEPELVAEPLSELESEIDRINRESELLDQSVEEMAGLDEQELLGVDVVGAESQEPIIDLSSAEDQQVLAEIDAMTGIQDSALEPGEGMLVADEEESLDALEAQLSEAAEELVAEPLEIDQSIEEADAELDEAFAELGKSLDDEGDLDLESELSELDLDLTSSTEEVDLESELADLDKELGAATDIDVELAALSGEDDLELHADEVDNPIQTKLELAEAYVDMGDPDGARSILEEVVAEGSEDQKIQAMEILDRLS